MANFREVRVRQSIAALSVVAVLWLRGCAHYEKRDLVPRTELESLNTRALPSGELIQLVPASPESPQAAGFDASNGLDDRELMAVAVMLNPELQAARATIGESEALLIAAKT